MSCSSSEPRRELEQHPEADASEGLARPHREEQRSGLQQLHRVPEAHPHRSQRACHRRMVSGRFEFLRCCQETVFGHKAAKTPIFGSCNQVPCRNYTSA